MPHQVPLLRATPLFTKTLTFKSEKAGVVNLIMVQMYMENLSNSLLIVS